MAPPKITVRGAAKGKGIPQGYVLGRTATGNGDVQLLRLRDLGTMGVASKADVKNLAFLNLIDVPPAYTSQALKLVRVNAGENALEFHQEMFTDLGDVPANYTASGLKAVRVNAAATGLEFVTMNGISSTTLTVTGAGTAAVTIELPNTAVTPGSYTNASISVDQKGRVTAAASGSASSPYVPLSSGDLANPALVFGNGMTISVPLTAAGIDTRLIAYLAAGLLAARPVSPNIPTGATTGYLATDTGKFFVWSGSTWKQTN